MRISGSRRRIVTVERRGYAPLSRRVLVPILSIAAALLIGAALLVYDGHSPLDVYREIVTSGFGGSREMIRTLILATPLTLTALAAAVAFRMRIWNIGAEGQLYMGAIFGSGVALMFTGLPGPLVVPIVLMGGVIGGAAWAGISAVLKAYINTDEVITTLMLTFVASHIMNYLIFGSSSLWRNPTRPGVLAAKVIPETAELPQVWGRLHLGFAIAAVLAVAIAWLLTSTRWGFEIRVVGDSPLAARYAGIHTKRVLISGLLVSGALAGIAGAIEVSGVTHALQPTALQTGVGFTGIVVAAIAFLNPVACVVVAVLLAGFLSSGSSLQTVGVPVDIVFLLQGIILLFVASGEFMLRNKVRFAFRGSRVAEPETP